MWSLALLTHQQESYLNPSDLTAELVNNIHLLTCAFQPLVLGHSQSKALSRGSENGTQ